MPKHTPGPWEAKLSCVGTQMVMANGPSFDHRIGQFGPNGTASAQQKANAKLAAAAPELLEQAELFARTLEYYIKRDTINKDEEGANMKRVTLHVLNKVIRKAKGL